MLFKDKGCQSQIINASLEGIVIRANGKIEDLGILGCWYDLGYWMNKLKSKKSGRHNPANVLTNVGLAITTNLLYQYTLPPVYASWGTGAGTAAVGNTTLFTEDYSTYNVGAKNRRVTSTPTQEDTGGQTHDTAQFVALLTAYGAQTITNFGLFDTHGEAANNTTPPSGGNLYCKSDFTGIVLAAADAIQFTAKMSYS